MKLILIIGGLFLVGCSDRPTDARVLSESKKLVDCLERGGTPMTAWYNAYTLSYCAMQEFPTYTEEMNTFTRKQLQHMAPVAIGEVVKCAGPGCESSDYVSSATHINSWMPLPPAGFGERSWFCPCKS